jgi:nitrous oxide reductase accessory protein NosL
MKEEPTMKKSILALIALTALAAACHEQRQDAPMDDAGIRAHAADSQRDLQHQAPPPSDQAR